MIFATIGTNEQPFDRLVAAVRGLPGVEPLLVQFGSSSEAHGRGDWRDFLSFEDMSDAVARSRVVVTHAGVGSIILALRHGKRPIVMPRRAHLNEAVDDHQVYLAQRLADAGYVTFVEDEHELAAAVAVVGRPTLVPEDAAPGPSGTLTGELREYLGLRVLPLAAPVEHAVETVALPSRARRVRA